MEGESSMVINGGMLYHEVQESRLCAVHCVNTVLQGPFFSEFDFAALASDMDHKEHQIMMFPPSESDSLYQESHNASLVGDFSIQVLEKALEVWDLRVIRLDSPVTGQAGTVPEQEQAFICHLQDHWYCIRQVNGEWYNFDSLLVAPHHLSKFHLAAYLESLKGSGWSIFVVRGNFPKECPSFSSFVAPSAYEQWLTPEEAERMIKSCSTPHLPHEKAGPSEDHVLIDKEDKDLNATISTSATVSGPSLPGSDVLPHEKVSQSEDHVLTEKEDKAFDATISTSTTVSEPSLLGSDVLSHEKVSQREDRVLTDKEDKALDATVSTSVTVSGPSLPGSDVLPHEKVCQSEDHVLIGKEDKALDATVSTSVAVSGPSLTGSDILPTQDKTDEEINTEQRD